MAVKFWKKVKTDKNLYTGDIKIVNDDSTKGKFSLNVDSLRNIRIKIYNFSGLKLGEFFLYEDTLDIVYLISKSYNKEVAEFYKNIKKDLCLNKVILELLEEINKKSDGSYQKKESCFNIEKNEIENKWIVYNNKGKEIFDFSMKEDYKKDEYRFLKLNFREKIRIELKVKKIEK